MKKVLSRKPASVYVEGSFVEQFLTEVLENKDIVTGISQAEAYVEMNMKDLEGKQVEIFVKHKEYKITAVTPVTTLKLEEV